MAEEIGSHKDPIDHPKDPFPTKDGKLIAPDYVKKEGDKLLLELRKAKPRILETPGGLAPSRIVVAKASPVIEWGQGSVTRQIPADDFSEAAATGTETSSAITAAKTPFLVYKATDQNHVPILKVFPGTIATKMPYLYQPGIADPDPGPPDPAGPRLDKLKTDPGLQPYFYPPNTPFSLFLWVHLKVVFPVPVTYQSHIDFVQVLSDDDALAVPDIDPMTGEIPEYYPIWEGNTDAEKALHTKGHFYIKIRDVGANVTLKTQYLFANQLTFVVAGTQVVVLV